MFKKSLTMFNFHSKRLLSLKQSAAIDWTKQEKLLMEPFEYIQKVPCKFHPLMATSFSHWLPVPEQKLDGIQEVMQTMMTWTILLDDIQDGSDYRYGVPAAHRVFGEGLTINAANRVLLLGQQQIADLGHPSAPEILLKVLEEYFYGQGIDIYWREHFICPTVNEHIDMVKKKSGSWFALPVELMQLFSSNTTNYSELANDVGVYHHMVDDYFNLFQPEELRRLAKIKQENHFVCSASDITESKLTLAIIHALQFPDIATELTDILKQRTNDPELQKHAILLLKKHSSDEYMRDGLKLIEAEIRKEIDRQGGNPILTAFMDEISLN